MDGVEYGEVRQYGNFSFTRVYESGHEVPFYQRKSGTNILVHAQDTDILRAAIAALQIFNRTINHFNVADGTMPVTANLTSTGPLNATHTESFVPLPPTSTSSAPAAYSSSAAATGAPVLPIEWRS